MALRLLIVEDESLLRRSLARFFLRLGFHSSRRPASPRLSSSSPGDLIRRPSSTWVCQTDQGSSCSTGWARSARS
jgi:hypothetical protein